MFRMGSLFFSLLIFTACANQPHQSSVAVKPVTVIDDIGRPVYLSRRPCRIVSLDPSVTEILFALGLDKEVVGVTSYCNYPPEAQHKTKIGGYIDPNLESIILLRPDLVVTTLKINTLKVVKQLEKFGMTVFVLDPERLQDVMENIKVLSRLTSREEKGNEILRQFRKDLDLVKRKMQNTYRPRVFLEMGEDPLISVGPGSFAHDLIELAGGRNIFAGMGARYFMCSLESIILADPEVIIVCSMDIGNNSLKQKEYWNRWQSISAVKNGRIYILSADLITRPGPRMVQGLKEMAKAIHPEKFAEEPN